MTDKKYTDEEIKKALECCRTLDAEACEECPAESDCLHIDLNELALDLINRYEAEIAEYQKHIDNDIIYVKRVKAEAIKEFAERLKVEMIDKKYKYVTETNYSKTVNAVIDACIVATDTVAKEMTGGETKTEKCDCFCEEQRIKGWLDGNTPITEPITVCNGTRERDECTCGGDKSKCDFYAKDYSYGY